MKDLSHRLPPHFNAPVGTCRWCGLPTGYKRRGYHPECRIPFLIATNPAVTRAAVFERDGGRCVDCGEIHPEGWDADHVVPLKDVRQQGLEFWGLGNLVTRGRRCHRAKTGGENSTRAKVKRIRTKHDDHVERMKEKASGRDSARSKGHRTNERDGGGKRKRRIPSRPFGNKGKTSLRRPAR